MKRLLIISLLLSVVIPGSAIARQTALQQNQNELQQPVIMQTPASGDFTATPQGDNTQALNPEVIEQPTLQVVGARPSQPTKVLGAQTAKSSNSSTLAAIMLLLSLAFLAAEIFYLRSRQKLPI